MSRRHKHYWRERVVGRGEALNPETGRIQNYHDTEMYCERCGKVQSTHRRFLYPVNWF